MIGLIVILACIAGGLTVSACGFVFALVWSGRLGLANSPQRRIQQAKNDAEVSRFQLQAAENRLETDRLIASRDLGNFKATIELQQLQDFQFQKQLEASSEAQRRDDSIPF